MHLTQPLPFLLGIAGPSCAGKSALARALAHRLGPPPQLVVELDRYYRDLAALPPAERGRLNFDEPAAFDWPLIESQLAELAQGRAVEAPNYDFSTHTRSGQPKRLKPTDFIVVEGLFALAHAPIRQLFGLTIFIAAGEDLRLARRVARDCAERGRTEDSVQAQWRDTVEPMRRLHLDACAAQADLLLDGALPLDELVAMVLARLPPANG